MLCLSNLILLGLNTYFSYKIFTLRYNLSMKRKKDIITRLYKHVLIFIVLLFGGIYLISTVEEQQKDRYLEMQTELLLAKYNTNYKYFKIMAADIYSMYQDNKYIINTLSQVQNADKETKAKLRENLYKKLYKKYKRLKNMGILQLHFHTKENISFLRMHEKTKFGDDLSSFRESVVLANKTLQPQDGFEIGKVVHGFRFVFPLFNKKEHIGSMEVSFSSEKLIESVANNNVIHSHFLVSKQIVDNVVFSDIKDLRYQPSTESPKFVLEYSTHGTLENQNIHKSIFNKDSVQRITKFMETGHDFSTSDSYNYESSVGSFVAIKGVKDTGTIAYLAIYSESDYLDNLIIEEKYIKILYTAIMFLIFLFSIYASLTRDKLHAMAHFDELTSLPNRAYFYIQLDQELKRAKRLKNNLSIMFIDLDGFKAVNDTYGHDIGDALLVDVSRRLEQCVRDVDIVARLGGDEFTVVLTEIKEIEDSARIADKIIKKLGKDFIINKKVVNIGASIGISSFPNNGEDSDTLIKKADHAMYIAKESGKNRAIVHKEEKKENITDV